MVDIKTLVANGFLDLDAVGEEANRSGVVLGHRDSRDADGNITETIQLELRHAEYAGIELWCVVDSWNCTWETSVCLTREEALAACWSYWERAEFNVA